MQIEISPRAESLLRLLTPDGAEPASLVEFAISELVEQRESVSAPATSDPDLRLKEEIQRGIDDIRAGRVAPLDIEDIKRRGRERLNKAQVDR